MFGDLCPTETERTPETARIENQVIIFIDITDLIGFVTGPQKPSRDAAHAGEYGMTQI
jgi:hypothetical protein